MDTSTSRRLPSASARQCASTRAAITPLTSFVESWWISMRGVTTLTSSSPPGSNGASPVADPLLESRRVVDAARDAGVVMRLLGGVAVCLQAPGDRPLLARKIGDIDVATKQGGKRAATEVLTAAGYVPDEHFNAFHGARRLLFYDQANGRKLDVFIGDFSMCHVIPIADRL